MPQNHIAIRIRRGRPRDEAARAIVELDRLLAWLLLLPLLCVFCGSARCAGVGAGPTVQEVIEFTRILQPLNHDADALQSQVSPDGQQAFIVTRKADVATDRNRFSVLLLDLDVERLSAGTAHVPMLIWSVDASKDEDDANPALRDARWTNNSTIVLRARLGDHPAQVYRLDVASRRATPLTDAPLGVLTFDVSNDLQRVVYVTPVPNPAMPPGARSVVVDTNSFWTVHFGQDDLRNQQRRFQFMVSNARSKRSARPLGASFPESNSGAPRASVSPDGRWALVPRYEPERQLEWGQRYPGIAQANAQHAPSMTLDPLNYYSRQISFVTRRIVAYRLTDGREQAVVDAPDDSLKNNQARSHGLWQRGSRSVVVAGTYLPEGAGTASVSHIIEYWPDSGRWVVVAPLKHRLSRALAVGAAGDGFVAVDGDEQRHFERTSDGRWHEVAAPAAAQLRNAWTLRVDEALNQPPDIVATGPTGQVRRLTRLNPQFTSETWGRMMDFGWKDAHGRAWLGGLMVPSGFDPNTAHGHALVIQTYGYSPSRFYRDGANIYDGLTSGFPGRAFLRENILVLALPARVPNVAPEDQRGQTVGFADGVRGAIDALVGLGWVDRDRIGLMGWSATGERALDLVTFTDAPIRAASLLDGDANTLFSMAITYAVNDSVARRKEQANEGGPYGDTLARWIRNDPSLHTDCIRAALRIEAYSPEVHNNWDIYALLRRQYKPVEMVMIPGGGHALARPSERMISLQGNVDWYNFWLNGERRVTPRLTGETAATLQQQYARWEQLRTLKRASDAKPDCVRDANWGKAAR